MKAFISLSLFIFSSFSILAQTPSKANPNADIGWLAFGLGPAIEYDFSGTININYGREVFYQCAFHRVEDISLGGGDPNNINSISFGVGYSNVSRFSRLAFSAGPSYVFGKDYKNNSNKRYKIKEFGVLLNTQVAFTPIKEMGLGIDFFINLNRESKFAGIAFTIFIEGNK